MKLFAMLLTITGLSFASAAAHTKAPGNDEFSWYIKSTSAENFCITVPTSQYRNGVVLIMSQCQDSPQQMFRVDPFTYYIQPADDTSWCLDFDFDDKKYRPLTLFKCGQTFSSFTDDKHQRWQWPNYKNGETGPLVNRGTKKCVGVGKEVYAGKYVQQYECDDVSEFTFAMAHKIA